jgi:hypothetical protein
MRLPTKIVTSMSLLLAACSAPRSNAPASASAPVERAEPPSPEEREPPVQQPAQAAAHAPSRAAKNPSPRSFDDDTANGPPAGFSFGRTGGGRAGRWVVHTVDGAQVLAQLDDDDTDDRYPVAVQDQPILRDIVVSVRCKMVSGRVDQACGLVARYVDENNYFITRANALENNVRLYTVQNGTRRQLASWKGRITPQTWHDYRFELRGDHLQVFWDGQRVLDHHDGTFSEPGRAGVWTKADSITYFDDLRVEPAP